jgi:hypothetical protein
VALMAGIVAIVDLLTAAVNDTLIASGYAPLVDGKILLGRVTQADHTAPPRIIFIPMKSTFAPAETYGTANYVDGRKYSDEQRSQLRMRALHTEWITFEVRCWGVGAEPSLESNLDATHTLYRAVIAATHLLTVGSYKLEPGGWVDAKEGTTQHLQYGSEFVFGISVATPVLDAPAAAGVASGELAIISAPDYVALNRTNTMIGADGTSSVGCEGS